MPHISLLALILCLTPILGVMWIGHKWSGSAWETGFATLRMLVQLLVVGFVLVFLFAEPSPLAGLIVVIIMIIASAAIGIRKVQENRRAAFWKACLAIGLPGALILFFVLFAILQLQDPWYQPRLAIPIACVIGRADYESSSR